MRLLFLGDVVGRAGRKAVYSDEHLARLRLIRSMASSDVPGFLAAAVAVAGLLWWRGRK